MSQHSHTTLEEPYNFGALEEPDIYSTCEDFDEHFRIDPRPPDDSTANKSVMQAALLQYSRQSDWVVACCWWLLCITPLACAVAWFLHFGWGYDTIDANPLAYFSYHPTLMCGGVVILLLNGALAWRLGPRFRRAAKFIHVMLTASGVCVCFVGFTVVYDVKEALERNHLVSLHSWMGVSTLSIMVLQWLTGAALFLRPRWFRSGSKMWGSTVATYIPTHKWMGRATAMICVCTVFLGFGSQSSLLIVDGEGERYLNAIAMFMVGIVLLFLFILMGGIFVQPVAPPQPLVMLLDGRQVAMSPDSASLADDSLVHGWLDGTLSEPGYSAGAAHRSLNHPFRRDRRR